MTLHYARIPFDSNLAKAKLVILNMSKINLMNLPAQLKSIIGQSQMSFFGLGFPELLIICLIFLLVLGPNSLPKVGKYLAKYLGGFRSASDEFKREIDVVVLEDKDPKEDSL